MEKVWDTMTEKEREDYVNQDYIPRSYILLDPDIFNDEDYNLKDLYSARLETHGVEEVLNGIKAFRSIFSGTVWMEVFIVLGINSMPNDVKKIAALVKEIQPARVHLNTVVRTPAEEFAGPVSKDVLENG